MHRFWATAIASLFESAAPRRTMLIGAGPGHLLTELLPACQRIDCVLDIVDASPHDAVRRMLRQNDGAAALHVMTGLDAIALLPPADLVLLDGDNWHNVYRELQLLFAGAVQSGEAAPMVLVHGTGWPYGRRDRYDDPDQVAERHDFARRGMVPGQSSLADDGVGGTQNNAVHEGGPRNGVLTAVENFVTSWQSQVVLSVLPFFNGLAVLVPEDRMDAAIQAALSAMLGPAALLQSCESLELDRIALHADLTAYKLSFARRSEALVRARARILELEADLARRRIR